MSSFASVTDLQTYLNTPFEDPGGIAQADMMLATATAAIQDYCRQTISLVLDDEAVLLGNWGHTLQLPERPVGGVSAVALGSVPLTAGVDYSFDGIWTLSRGGPCCASRHARTTGAWWGSPDTPVTVTYTHGFTEIPRLIWSLCMALAARGIDAPAGGTTGETITAYSYTRDSAAAGAVALTEDDKALLRSGGYRPAVRLTPGYR